MNDNNYPNYFIAGDIASKKAQTWYIRLVAIDLLLMVVSALLSIYNYQTEESKTIVYWISGGMLFMAMLISVFLKLKKYEDIWYRGRALAESCKTLTWRFIMRSEYFESTITDEEAKHRFVARIREINNQFVDLNKILSAKKLNLPVITSEMEKIRKLSLDKRKKYYLDERIQSQIDWYSSKADNNKSKYERWFLGVIVFQFLAVASIVYLIKVPMSNFNLVGLFSTVSASGFSWLQVKKYQENKEAYTTATSELILIKAEGNKNLPEDKFSEYVLDSENAMSREHTMWLAQKRF
ncbi:DUF4231 domain-containing protein [Chryseobacterium sp. SIMBA_029]|uniref:DUF4231 domain-containing protein n=1 Tax=Chryseobacterium sp. SIMBA_029 TaxID=3085772 RepID=UPI00397E138E